MSIDEYLDDEDEDDLFDFEDDEEDEDLCEFEDEGDAIDWQLMHKMVKMSRKREDQEHGVALEEREKMLKEKANLCGPTFFDTKDLYLPQGENK